MTAKEKESYYENASQASKIRSGLHYWCNEWNTLKFIHKERRKCGRREVAKREAAHTHTREKKKKKQHTSLITLHMGEPERRDKSVRLPCCFNESAQETLNDAPHLCTSLMDPMREATFCRYGSQSSEALVFDVCLSVLCALFSSQ
jgi:hypothetical protein